MKAVLDAGPIIHLEQIDRLELLEVISSSYITEEIRDEVGKAIIQKTDLEVKDLEASSKDRAKHLSSKHGIELGESTAIALGKQLGLNYIFTDDLDTRKTAEKVNLEPHGTLALVTKAYSKNIIDREEAEKTVNLLYKDSSLFITKDLVKWTKEQIK
jgi:predicted nucleic acid-binding protein